MPHPVNRAKTQPTARTVEELIDGFDLVRKLRQQHWLQLLIGVVLTALTIGYNLVTPPATPWFDYRLSIVIAALFLVSGALWVRIMVRRARDRRAQPAMSIRDHALRLIDTASQTTRTLLYWATAGQLLTGLGTVARLKFGDFPTDVLLWAGIAPTVALLVYGVLAAPTRERVLRR